MSLWNYDILSMFKQSRIGNNVIGFDDLKRERNQVYKGEECHCWIANKDKKEYLMLNKDIENLPIRIKKTKTIMDGHNIYHFIEAYSKIGFVPEKCCTFRELVNEFFDVKHSNNAHFTLFKILALASYITRINVRLCSNIEFGKDGTFLTLNYLTNRVAVFDKPRTVAKLEYGVINDVLVINELIPKTEEERRNIHEFLLPLGSFTPQYQKKSRASYSYGTKDVYDVSNLSVVLCYNTLNEFAEVDKQYYFDNVFGKPVLERYMPFLFKGRIDVEQFIAKENYSEDMDEKLLGIARTIQWYKQNYATELKPYRIDLSRLNISGRQKKSFAHITDFLNLYSNDEHEFRNLVNDLLECYYAYMRMIKGNNLVSDYNKEGLR